MRFAEEIILLLLRDEGGSFVRVPPWSLRYAVAGSVLMDLAMENRIDTDLEHLLLTDDTPTGDELLDPTLAAIAAGDNHDTRFWLEHTAAGADAIHALALSHLIDRGILERREDRFLWVFRSRRYPAVDGTARREVKLRMMGVLFSDEIPDPRDVMIICLADACGILGKLLSAREANEATARIEQVRKLELIGQAMSRAIDDVRMAIAASTAQHMY